MNPTPDDTRPFEDCVRELDSVLAALEDGSTTLEASLAHYERGVGLLKVCYGKLRDTERRIQLLAGESEGGEPLLRPFEHAAALSQDAPGKRVRRRGPSEAGE